VRRILSPTSPSLVNKTHTINQREVKNRVGVVAVKCEFCGGTLVWDYGSGEIVCSQCGVVQGRIFSSDIPGCEAAPTRDQEAGAEKRGTHSAVKLYSSRYKRLLKLYLAACKRVGSKPWLEVDYNKLFKTGRFVKTITSTLSKRARESIGKHDYWEVVNRGIRVLESVNPALLARSERCKYALAYMVAVAAETGKIPSEEEVVSVFNVSETSYRRLRLIATSIQSRHALTQLKNT
jgi:transcription initiation factor TFIIIB Brf1 subunit/transcription initiation factor TFIIB